MRPLPGTRVGKYRVERPLAEGGMGTIYEATHEGLGTRVALKLLHPQLRERPGFVARFLQEARVAAQLKSPHIVPVLDVDADGAYLVMELLSGETVAQVLARDRRMPKDRALDVAIQVLAGLDVAHRAGVVHRDLKPDNVMLVPTRDGLRATILDFGIAKLKSSSEYLHGLTRPGATMGTPEYMAPEQAHSADTVDVRADIYAVGVLLYEMLSGKRPATGDDAREIATFVETRRITSLGVHDPSLPDALVVAVHRAMEPRAEGRFGSAAELAQALVPAASVLSLVAHQALAALSSPTPSTLASAGRVPKTLPPEPARGGDATAPRAPLAEAAAPRGTDFAPPIAPPAPEPRYPTAAHPASTPPPPVAAPRPTSALAAPLAPAARGKRRASPTWALALLGAATGGLVVALFLATRDKGDDGPPPASATTAPPVASPAPPPSIATPPVAPLPPTTPTSLPPPPTAPRPAASTAPRDGGADGGDAGTPMFPGFPGIDAGLPPIPSGLPPIKIQVPIPIPGFPQLAMSGADLPSSLGAPPPGERGPDDAPEGLLARAGARFTAFAERYLPDAFVFALLATALVVGAAVLTSGATPLQVLTMWGDGFWDLIPFTLQMSLVIITGYVLATSRPIYRLIARIAAVPSSPRAAVAWVALFAMASSWLNWGFSLIFSAMLAKETARRHARVDYRAVCAASFLGLGSVWAQGLSGSAALQMATASAMSKEVREIVSGGGKLPGGVIPLSQTIFLWQSLVSVVVEIVIVTAVMYAAAPSAARAKSAADLGVELGPSPLAVEPAVAPRTPGERLEHSRALSLMFVAMSGAYLVSTFAVGKKGLAGITLNVIILAFLSLGFLLHGTPARLMRAFKEATPGVWGVILQFPFYAGLAAVMTKTHLSAAVAHFFVGISTARTFPAVIAVYSAVLGVFVPSGGSKWVIEAPYVMQAAHELRVNLGWMVAVYDLGEALANLVQPFWMLPILGLLGLRARDVMGYTFLVCAVLTPVVLALVTALGATLSYP